MEKHNGGNSHPPGHNMPSHRSMNMQKVNSGHNRILNDSIETPHFDPDSLGVSKQNSSGLGLGHDALNSSTSVSARHNRAILQPRVDICEPFVTT